MLAIIAIQSSCFAIGGMGSLAQFILYILMPTLLTAMAGYVINTYFDGEKDKANHKPVVSKKGLLPFYFALNGAALILAYFDNMSLLLVVLAIQIILFLYSFVLSNWPLIGNLVIAAISCMVVAIFYFGTMVSVEILNLWVFILSIFMVSLSREIIKDIEDLEGDKKAGAITLPVIWGAKMSHVFADLLLISNAVFIFAWSYYDFYLEHNLAFGVGVCLSLLAIAIVLWSHMNNSSYAAMSRLLKVYMFLGLAILPFLANV